MPRKVTDTDGDSAKKSKKPRADWTPELRLLAINAMEAVTIQSQGSLPDLGFKGPQWALITTIFNKSALKDKLIATPYDEDQIKSMYSTLQAEYRTFARYKGKSGWSWDEIEKKITTSDENWEEVLQ
ncbi:hypothetical protein HDU93_006121, partial [Gonapodya sp. JEL0774]